MSARFAAKISPEPNTGCHLWAGAVQSSGYGSIGIGDEKTALAHRVAWELERGPIPDALTVDHLCRNTLCVNTAHMELVPREVNAQRATAAMTHCRKGHPLSGPNLYVPASGKRHCRACRAATNRRYEAKQATR